MPRLRLALASCLWLACACVAQAQDGPRRVFIAGDSTASDYGPERAPREGWGMRLQALLDPAAWEVRNHAQSGRSARSFIEQGWLEGIDRDLRAGDVLLVQFGHNDEKSEDPARYDEPAEAFPAWLMRYVALARAHGATPILITPVARRKFDAEDRPIDTHGAYAASVRALAGREHLGLIDLDASSRAWLGALGDVPSRAYFMYVPERRSPDQPQADDTHFRDRGAAVIACLVVTGWRVLDPALATTLPPAADCASR